MFSSLRTPLALSLFSLAAGGLLGGEALLRREVRLAYLHNAENSLSQQCSLIGRLLGRHMDQVALTVRERKLITDEMVRLSVQVSGQFAVVNWKGDVLESSAHMQRNLRHLPEVVSALHGQADAALRDDALSVAVPMFTRGKFTGVIYGSRSLAELDLLLLDLRERFLSVAGLALGLTALLSLALARGLTAPLSRLRATVQRFGAGERQLRAAVRSQDEVAALAGAFNAMADRLEAQHETLLRFISDASHELKTPVASLRSTVEALEAGAHTDPSLRERFFGHLHRDLDRMQRLTQDLLELHRLERSALALRIEPLDLALFLQDYELPLNAEGNCCVLADRGRLDQVVSNLVSNARRATRDQPTPAITLHARPGVFWVADNGVGLEANQLEAIFQRFHRVDSARSRQDGGTGLGLAITRALVEAMGGTIQASSSGPGCGAEFRVSLPGA